jgi:mono/diheme cytochrome c family protein
VKGLPALLLICVVTAGHAAGDPVRGEKLHQDCLGCHGTELYAPSRAKVKTERWNDRMNPKFSRQEIEDIVAWLNRDFYRFPP